MNTGTPTRIDRDRISAKPARPLPGVDPDLTALAHGMVRLAAQALAQSDDLFLAVIASPHDRRGPLILAYGHDLSARPVRLATVARSGARLLARLALRWPPYARPVELGVITDGTGVGLARDALSPEGASWLARQAADPARLTEIIAFASHAPWHLLSGTPPNDLLH